MTNTAGPHFIHSGYRLDTSPYLQSTAGYYWSSSAFTSATNACRLLLDGTNSAVYPAYNGGKSVGFSLRCLAQ